MRMIFHFLYVMIICVCLSCSATVEKQQKINGVSYVASDSAISETMVEPLVALHANYAALMPFGFIRSLDHPEIKYNTERQWFGERKEGITQYAEMLRTRHIKIMLKPQIWVMRGEFTGNITMSNPVEWDLLQTSYSKFILDYARLAQEIDAEIFCIGTELRAFVEARPRFWMQLIEEVKSVYFGKVTYAANWNEYEHTPFWEALDYIGVDAYFPVDAQQSPTLSESKNGWQKHKFALEKLAIKINKPILFTEFGYRSIDFAGRAPWTTDRVDKHVNLEAQQILTQALFEEFWHEDWFAGGFLWKWYHQHPNSGGEKDNRFTPQNKPAEEIIRGFYKKFTL